LPIVVVRSPMVFGIPLSRSGSFARTLVMSLMLAP
jgi:hypothetical protein